MEIFPETSASFSSKVKRVIAIESVENYQPGKVFVNYDLYDNAKADIDLSWHFNPVFLYAISHNPATFAANDGL